MREARSHGSLRSMVDPAEGNRSGAYFGSSVGTAGDVNGDGYADVTVGAAGAGVVKAYAYYGSASGLSLDFNWAAESNQASAWFGWSVSGAGVVNGDGLDDVIIGAMQFGHPQTWEGIAVAYHGEL
jgi:hypothetical protein